MNDPDFGDACKYVNDSTIEMAWAMKAAERANIHMNLLMCCDTKVLKLNKQQDIIYTTFRRTFPDLDVHKVLYESIEVTEVDLKHGGMKEKWHDFCEAFREIVDDYSLGTLMRIEACKGYSEENTIVVPKIIYLAIEIARNIEGINEKLKAEFTEDHKKNGAPL
uniref:Polysacc_synt_4 domain-containing protein n=1 Tax=Angiostrongylus cantonensis TaxID=6313 RepID=A0A0K0CTK2_ANGCA